MTLIMLLPVRSHKPDRTVKIFLNLNVLIMNPSDPANEVESNQEFDRNFKPRGAIAFFILLILLGMVIWYGIYFLMLDRI